MQPSSHAPQHASQPLAGLVPPRAATQAEPSLLRALAFGIGVVLAGLVLAWGMGLLPPATTGYVALGAGAALLAGVVALWLHGRFLDRRAEASFARDGRLMAGRLQGLLAAAFGVKLAVVVLGVLYLQRALAAEQPDVKFAATASFCIAFAAASLVCQLATAGYLARALGRRRTMPGAAPQTTSPDSGPAQPAPNASAR
jgi:hypothetical protein